jgi:hypothetical protein
VLQQTSPLPSSAERQPRARGERETKDLLFMQAFGKSQDAQKPNMAYQGDLG